MKQDSNSVKQDMQFAAFQVTPAGEIYEQEFLSVAASIEAHSSHWVAPRIVQIAKHNNLPIHPVVGFQDFEGKGAGAAVEVGPGVYRAAVIGRLEFLEELGMKIPELLVVASRRWLEGGSLVVYAGWDGWVRGILKFIDAPELNQS